MYVLETFCRTHLFLGFLSLIRFKRSTLIYMFIRHSVLKYK